MKPRSTARLSFPLASAIAALLAAPALHATNLYWDSNTTTAGAGATPTGTWGTSNFWNNTDPLGVANTFQTATTNADDLFFVAGPGAASGNNAYVVTVSLAQVAKSLTFQASGATTLSGGTSITLGDGTAGVGGITMNQFAYGAVAQGAVTISTALSLANSQTWTNNSTNALTFGQVTLGSTLTFAGSGNFTATAASFGNAGTGGIIMNGTGVLNTRVATSTNYTGSTTINSGIVLLNAGTKSTGNFNLAGGMVTDYFQQTGAFTSGLGTGSNQIQITGNSGFGAGNGTSVWRIGTGGSVLIWGASGEGAATGFFNPTTLKFMTAADNLGPTIFGIVNFDNGLNLNGVARTIDVFIGSNPPPTTSGASIAGVISNGSLIKTGGGNLTLANAGNSWGGTTTISGGFLTVAATGALGSASNSLEFNGGALRATGTVTSPSTRAVTMTATGIIDTNGQAISIAGNIGGLGGLTKNGTGTLTLSGTNSYGGVTTVNAGTLAITKEASLASNTAANLNVKSGAGLALNVDSTGAAGFTVANLDTLLGNILVANTSTQGLQNGAILSLDTGATTFTLGNAITNSTGASGGVISLIKLGTGTLVLEDANTYTGPTTISAGTLRLDAGGVISTTTPLLNNATFAFNSAGAVTQGTNFGLIAGTGALTKTLGGTLTLNLANTFSGTTTVSAGTLALTNGLALQNSALVTTSGTSTYSGGAALTIGGLSGATGDLGSASVLNGYTGLVTALTLNPQTGVSVTYGGIISNGSGAMSLTKTGAGTQILTGANSYTGATNVNQGTLTIGVGGSLSSSSALQINGGTFTYNNTSAGQTLNGLAVGAGNSTVSNTASGQTLTLGAITRTASIYGTVNFATLTGPINTSTTNTDSIIGPWATTGSTTTLRYAVGGGNITPFTTGTAGGANLVSVTDLTVNYEYSLAVTTAGNLTGNTLRYSGGALGTALGAANTLTLNGLMNAGTGLLTISGGPSGGGLLIGSTGELVITANAQATTISATIGGTGRLVYSGGAGALSLSSLTNAYTLGTVVNSGTLTLTGTANTDVNAVLGGTSGGIILNGGQLRLAGVNVSAARIVTVNGVGSSMFVNKNNNFATTGKLTGDGTLSTLDGGGSGTLSTYSFNSTSNDYTGRLSGTNTIINVNSFGNSTNSIALDGATFNYGTGATGATSLANRVIEMSGTTGGATINNANTASSSANTLSIGGGVVVTGVGNKTLTLGGANTGANTFGGNISDGPGSVISLTKADAGQWVLGGSNTYTGATTLSAGTLTLTNGNAIKNSALTISAGTLLSLRHNTNNTTFANAGTTTISGSATINVDNNGSGTGNTLNLDGAVNVTAATTATLTVTNGNGYILGLGAVTQSPTTATTLTIANAAPMTMASFTTLSTATPKLSFTGTGIATITGNINQSGSAALALERATAAGTLILQGTSNMTGAVTISNGTIQTAVATNAFGSTSGISIGASGTLALRGDANAAFSNGTTNYPVALTASGATINVDQASSATAGTTLTLGTVAMPGAYTLNTTGANGVSLGLGAVTGSTANNKVINNTIASPGGLTLASYAETDATARTITFQGTGNTTVTGTITQNGANALALTKSGTGVLTLSGSSSNTGVTTAGGGVLLLNHATALSGGIASTGGTSNLTISGSGIVGLTANSGNFNRGIGTGVTQVQWTGSGGFAAYGGTRTVLFSGSSINWTATNFIATGFSLVLSHSTADATLDWQQLISLAGAARTIQVDNGSASIDAIISAVITGGSAGNSPLTKSGSGTLQLTAANSWDGSMLITGGTLMLGDGAAGGDSGRIGTAASQISISSGAVLAINRTNSLAQGATSGLGNNAPIVGAGSVLMMGGNSGTGTLTLNQANTFTGGFTLQAGTLRIGSNGSAGVSGPLGNGGTFTINGGTLDTTATRTLLNVNPISVGGNFAFAGTGDLTMPGTVDLGAATRTITTTAGTLTLADVVSNGGLIKAGAGTLALSGTNTYTGATAVNAGKLLVLGSIGGSTVMVNNAGTILATDAAASFGSTVGISTGAILAPGDAGAAGTATVTGATTFNNGSIFSWDIDAAGTGYDKLVSASLTGEVTAGDAVFRIVASDATFADTFWATTQTWTNIFTTDGSAAIANWADIFSVTVVNSSFAAITPVGGSFSAAGNTLTWTAIPEPTSALAGLLLGAGLLRRRR